MEIITKFSLGDKVWRIGANGKAECFEIGAILYDGAVYYGKNRYDVQIESRCFAKKDELIAYICDNGNENV